MPKKHYRTEEWETYDTAELAPNERVVQAQHYFETFPDLSQKGYWKVLIERDG